ncbi:hypothetical protein ASG76_05150 [Nocardioides sp. Soil774]|uniref:serine/threonine-protein kinase n=1 Tax=Nocardioides sp. Soil774 TaxID=1736408 RepID=UPI0006FB0E72|nr:serine/threonine-protein kinase [Nocardioides sp. Soil774]KRE95078.1 hypothetical protein ASG76_05150 [Nocardioides sp. Soil774]
MSLPEQLGRLRRVRRIGTGGFATVWLCHDDALDSEVAVKVLADNWAQDADVRERFLDEARLLRRASSPHLVQVHDVGVTPDGTPYFVMTYADGGSVADLLASGHRPTPAEVVDIVSQAAQGLAALHARDVVHRDIKPQNLLLASRPGGGRTVLVADLGVAKALTTDSGATLHVGTPAYGAPEQADPDVAVDPRADVYALGAVTRALVTGRPPRPAGPGTPLPPLAELVPGVPEAVDEVVRTAMQPRREHRWPDVTSYARALAAAVAGTTSPVPAPPAPPVRPTRGSGPLWRRPLPVVAAACALLAVAALAFALTRRGSDGDGSVNGYEVAAKRFLTALQERDCDTAGSMIDQPEGWDCTTPADGEFDYAGTADWVNPEAPTRVEDLGDGLFRVVFVDQGYVLVRQRDNTTMAVEGLVGGVEQDPDGKATPPPG